MMRSQKINQKLILEDEPVVALQNVAPQHSGQICPYPNCGAALIRYQQLVSVASL